MSKPDNPPAFPLQMSPHFTVAGITLRDYFAGQVISALILKPVSANMLMSDKERVRRAYEFADEMLAEREKP